MAITYMAERNSQKGYSKISLGYAFPGFLTSTCTEIAGKDTANLKFMAFHTKSNKHIPTIQPKKLNISDKVVCVCVCVCVCECVYHQKT
jgi:hypothetical protein